MVFAAVDIEKPVDIGPSSVFWRSLSNWSELNSNWVPLISMIFSAASLARSSFSLVSSVSFCCC